MCTLEQSIAMMNKLSLNEKSPNEYNFINSKTAILTAGEYKGYSCFITEVSPMCIELLFREDTYVFVNENDEKKIGDKIVTEFGKYTILDIIPEMYEICTKNDERIRLPCEAFNDIGEVIDKKYTTHYGKSGKIIRKIGRQYCVYNNHYVMFTKNMIKHLKDDLFVVKCGEYKNKIGKLFKMHEKKFTVVLDTNGKKINNIVCVDKNGEVVCRNILKSDIFNVDVILKSENKSVYFKVNKVISENPLIVSGIKYMSNKQDESVITINDIDIINFKIIEKKKSKYEENNIDEKTYYTEVKEQEQEHDKDDEYDDEREIDQYDDENKDDENKDDENKDNNRDNKIYENLEVEVEMKSTFKDAGRLNFMENKLSEKDNQVLKLIEKCKKSFEYDTENTFIIINKVHECIELFKTDILKLKETDANKKNVKNMELIKKTDYTFIVALFLLYDMVKNGYIMQKSLDDYIEKLYNDNYLKGAFISGSIFLRKDKSVGFSTIFSKIQMTDIEYESTKELLKRKNHLEVIKIMVNNCDKLLQDMFGKIIFNNNNKIEYIPIVRNNKMENYPKYFLTSKDLISNNISSDAKRILTSPLINKWVSELRKKEKCIENKKTKEIYRYIINNFYKAPIILSSVDIQSDVKYIELNRVYNKYVSKLDIHLKERDIVRKKKMDLKSKESLKILLKRNLL